MVTMKIAYNPNLVADAIQYLRLTSNSDDVARAIDAMDSELKKRLELFLDRRDFVDHLKALSDEARAQRWVVRGQDVRGVDNDIAALRLYLLLTCIDICAGRNGKVKNRFKKAFTRAPQHLLDDLTSNLTVDGNNTIERIWNALYGLRNSYTHSGVRFLVDGDKQYVQCQLTEDQSVIFIAPGFDLMETLSEIISAFARSTFGLS